MHVLARTGADTTPKSKSFKYDKDSEIPKMKAAAERWLKSMGVWWVMGSVSKMLSLTRFLRRVSPMICLLLPFAGGYPQNAFRRHSVKKGSAVGRSEVPLATRLRSREPLSWLFCIARVITHGVWSQELWKKSQQKMWMRGTSDFRKGIYIFCNSKLIQT